MVLEKANTYYGCMALEIIGPRKYTLKHFLSFAEQMQTKAKWLNAHAKKTDGDEGAWTAQRVQLCLYAEFRDAPDARKKSKKAADAPAAKTGKKAAATRDEEDDAPQTRSKRRKTTR